MFAVVVVVDAVAVVVADVVGVAVVELVDDFFAVDVIYFHSVWLLLSLQMYIVYVVGSLDVYYDDSDANDDNYDDYSVDENLNYLSCRMSYSYLADVT